MTWTVRAAEAGDLSTLVAFNQQMALDTEGKALDEAVLTAGVQRALADARLARYFVVEDEDGPEGPAVVGQLMLTEEWSDWRNGRFLWIQSVYVRPSHRRRGVYRALHDHVVAMAAMDADVVGVRLYVETDNSVAQSTYADLGMQRCGYLMYEQLVP
jgi:ribosomal protein S18 acetylase RimI-like enzyme